MLAFDRGIKISVHDLWVQPVSGNHPVQLTQMMHIALRGLTWTTDGKEIVYSGTDERQKAYELGLWRISALGGEPERVPDIGAKVAYPSISPKGNRLAYVQRSETDSNILRLPGPKLSVEERSASRFISSTKDDGFPSYSSDGEKVAFLSDRTGYGNIWVCNSDGSSPRQLTNFESFVSPPLWSPTGRHLLFWSDKELNPDVYVVGLDGSTPRRLTDHKKADWGRSWSRDGKWVYFASSRTEPWQIWKVSVEGGEPIQVTHGGGAYGEESPDGKTLYFGKGDNSGVWQVPTDGGKETCFLDRENLWILPSAMEKIYLVARTEREWSLGYLNPQTREVTQIFENLGNEDFKAYDLAEDGAVFLIANSVPGGEEWWIEFVNFQTREVTEIIRQTSSTAPRDIAVSPDGQSILIEESGDLDYDIWLAENFR
jgi:Tol biopolymer transport system component